MYIARYNKEFPMKMFFVFFGWCFALLTQVVLSSELTVYKNIQCDFELSINRKVEDAGKPIYLKYTIKNNSNYKLKIIKQRSCVNTNISVKYNGKEYNKMTEYMLQVLENRSDASIKSHIILPGESECFIMNISRMYDFSKAGEYSIDSCIDVYLQNNELMSKTIGKAMICSNPITINVVEPKTFLLHKTSVKDKSDKEAVALESSFYKTQMCVLAINSILSMYKSDENMINPDYFKVLGVSINEVAQIMDVNMERELIVIKNKENMHDLSTVLNSIKHKIEIWQRAQKELAR